jgi:hypothetical protein
MRFLSYLFKSRNVFMRNQLLSDKTPRLLSLQHYEVSSITPIQGFYDLTHLAAQICGIPILVTTLINQEWLSSNLRLICLRLKLSAYVILCLNHSQT